MFSKFLVEDKEDRAEFGYTPEWKEFCLHLSSLALRSDKLVSAHNENTKNTKASAINIQSIDEVVRLLAVFKKEADKLHTFDLSGMVLYAEIQLAKLGLYDRIIQLNKILSGKYFLKSKLATSANKKKQFMQLAYDAITLACKIRQEHIADLPKDYDVFLEESLRDVTEHYEYLFPNESKNEINIIVNQARKMTDPHQACIKLQEAFDLAKKTADFTLQFDLASELADRYAFIFSQDEASNANVEDINTKYKHMTITANLIIFCIDLMLSKNITGITHSKLENGCFMLYRLADILLPMSQAKCISQEFDKRKAMLADAKLYQEWADKVSGSTRQELMKYKDFSELLSKNIKNIESKMEKQIQEELDKREYERKMEMLTEEFNSEFQKIWDSLSAMDASNARKPRRPKLKKTEDNVIWNQNENDSSSASSEDEVLYEPMNDLIECSSKYTFDFYGNKALLDLAVQNNDFEQQAELNYAFFEDYKINAFRSIRWHHEASVIINHLQLAIHHLQMVANIIHIIKPEVKQKIEKWMPDHLKEATCLLDDTLAEQNDIKRRFEISRESARAHIIQKYGRLKWYKPEPITDISLLSLHAQILINAEDNVNLLEDMSYDIRCVTKYFNESKESEKLQVNTQNKNNAELQVNAEDKKNENMQVYVENNKNEEPLADNSNLSEKVILPRCKTVAAFTFFNRTQDSMRSRSKSVNSCHDDTPRNKLF